MNGLSRLPSLVHEETCPGEDPRGADTMPGHASCRQRLSLSASLGFATTQISAETAYGILWKRLASIPDSLQPSRFIH